MEEYTYEFQCMRAELLGIEKPTLEEFEKLREEKLKQLQEELEAVETQLLEDQDEDLGNVNSRLDELNSILSSTQQKLNRFKHTACSSLTNIFSRSGSVDMGVPSTVTAAQTEAATILNARRNTTVGTTHINAPLNELKQIEEEQSIFGGPAIPTEKIRAAKMDLEKKMGSQLNKLDSLISKAENAEILMSEQTKQMRKMAK